MAPRNPQARRRYLDGLRRQYRAGMLLARVRSGGLPDELLNTLLPHLAEPVVPEA